VLAHGAASILLRGVPGGDRLDLVVGETLGDAVHDGRGPPARPELVHRGRDPGGILAEELAPGGASVAEAAAGAASAAVRMAAAALAIIGMALRS
jgi:hypothetical protein